MQLLQEIFIEKKPAKRVIFIQLMNKKNFLTKNKTTTQIRQRQTIFNKLKIKKLKENNNSHPSTQFFTLPFRLCFAFSLREISILFDSFLFSVVLLCLFLF